ncbi:MAG: hypothetical protein EBR94_08725 [Bacteroidetes bacterium]|nr:hypothetical protein [Bacteroidota bacterium]
MCSAGKHVDTVTIRRDTGTIRDDTVTLGADTGTLGQGFVMTPQEFISNSLSLRLSNRWGNRLSTIYFCGLFCRLVFRAFFQGTTKTVRFFPSLITDSTVGNNKSF